LSIFGLAAVGAIVGAIVGATVGAVVATGACVEPPVDGAVVGVEAGCDPQLVIIMLATRRKLNRYHIFFFILLSFLFTLVSDL
jgi:hypothetical protein